MARSRPGTMGNERMELRRDWTLALDVDAVLRGQGADPAVIRARRPALLALAERALAAGLPQLAPATLSRRVVVQEFSHERLVLAGGAALTGPLVARQLAGAGEVFVCLLTIGPALEQWSSAAFATDPGYALALDGLANAAVTALTEAVCACLAAQVAAEGLRTTIALSPGLEGWPVDVGQPQLFALLEATQVGVALTPEALMLPRKSGSFVMGIGPAVDRAGEPCDYCSQRATCRHRSQASGVTRPKPHGA